MDICYYMNGGVTRDEALGMSPAERLEHIEFINSIYQRKAEAMTGQEFM
jgi:hypothetical protein